jgi:hypothetical protein
MVSRIRNLVGAVIILAVVSAPAQVKAQGWEVDLYGGVGLPVSTLGDFQNAGFSIGVGGGYILPGRFMVRGDFASEFLQTKANGILPAPEMEDVSVRLYHLDAALAINFVPPNTGRMIFAFDFGAGITHVDFNQGASTERPNSTTRFTIPAGVILGYKMSDSFALFIRGRYYVMFMGDNSLFGSSTWQTIPLWAGISMRG